MEKPRVRILLLFESGQQSISHGAQMVGERSA